MQVTYGDTAGTQSWDVEKDDGSGAYSGPHWQDNPARRYPYLYLQGATMEIVNAQWKVGKPVPGATYTVKGTGPGGINIPPTVATLTGNVLQINGVAATAAFAANLVKFYNTFNITWQVSVNGGAYQSAGTSNNPIYVCLRGVVGGLPTPYRTVVHLACATDGATNADQAVTNTWSRLSGPSNLNAWNETAQAWTRPLYYYKPGTTFGGNAVGTTYSDSAAALLQSPNSTGQCSTWAMLMYDAIRLNNASATYILANGNLPTIVRFLVKDWVLSASSSSSSSKSSGSTNWYMFKFGTSIADMIPQPVVGGKPSQVYGSFTNQNTIVGQNSAPSAPSEKVFSNHQFLQYTNAGGTTTYYDASYGVTYTGTLNFQQNAVYGYGQAGAVVGGFLQMLVELTPAANGITFTPNPFGPIGY